MSPDGLRQSTAAELLRFQRLAWSNLVFSLTRRCPLKCAHCVTSSAPDAALSVADPVTADRWADELPELAALGLRTVTFTGGEPTLALRQVERLARAARAAGLRTALVTSGSWGASDAQTKRLMEALGPFIQSWDFGYDSFHAQHLPMENIVRAVTAAAGQRAEVAIRICEDDPDVTHALVEALRQRVPAGVTLIVQPVHAVGRGTDLPRPKAEGPNLRMPCLATGPFVREDGSVGPCCAALGYGARGRQPFEYGAADGIGLLEAWRRWRADPLLRLIRLAGFTLPLRWLAEDGLLDATALETGHICETCERLWDSDGRVGAALRRRASEPALGVLLDRLEVELYGSVWTEHKPPARVDQTSIE
jgi:pyruvate-formate lyase-activating enzyme